jgi:hypothetical protein
MQPDHPSHRFQVALQLSATDAPIVLRSAADPNLATLAFHEELQRLTTQGVTGELVMRNHQHSRTPILRQPLEHPASPPELNR